MDYQKVIIILLIILIGILVLPIFMGHRPRESVSQEKKEEESTISYYLPYWNYPTRGYFDYWYDNSDYYFYPRYFWGRDRYYPQEHHHHHHKPHPPGPTPPHPPGPTPPPPPGPGPTPPPPPGPGPTPPPPPGPGPTPPPLPGPTSIGIQPPIPSLGGGGGGGGGLPMGGGASPHMGGGVSGPSHFTNIEEKDEVQPMEPTPPSEMVKVDLAIQTES